VRNVVAFSVTLTLLLVACIVPALAAEAPAGPAAAISSPAHAAVITGDTAAVTVLFDAGTGSKVSAAELYVDGELHDTVAVSPPMASGSCKLTWRCGEFDKGDHTLTARVYDTTGHSRAVEVEVMLESAAAPGPAGERLRVEIMAPTEGQEISGTTQVRVTTDESRVRYVMLLIDDVFVALTNMPPFTYSLNTTRYLNGVHALRATAFDLTDNSIDSPTIHVIINNPGGRTEMREQPNAPTATASPTPPAPLQTISEPPTVRPSSPAQAQVPTAPVRQPLGTAAEVSAPDVLAAGSDTAIGQSGTPSAPSMATPRAIVAPAAKVGPAPRAASAPAAKATAAPAPKVSVAPLPAPAAPLAPDVKPSTAMALKPDRAAPATSTPISSKPTSDARFTAAVASTGLPATSDEPAGAPSSPAIADARSSAPKPPVRMAMAPPAPVSVEKPTAPAVETSSPEIQVAASVSDDPVAATSRVAAASAISMLPKVAALPPAARTAAIAPVVSSVAAAGPTSAPAGAQVVALATEVPQRAAIAPAPPVTKAPRAAAPVQVARAPSAPVVVSATVAARGEVIIHTVAPGEQLGSISAKYEIPEAVIARFNGLTSHAQLAAGRTLRIPWKSTLVLNGEPVYTDVATVNEGSITLAPFRAIVEHSGGAVHWIAAKQQVRALAFSHDIWVTMGSRAATVDSAEYMLETESKLVRDRAMVPLGLFRDALGFKVSFEPNTGRIYLAAQ
jgi:LysM repeat protein